MGLVEIENDAVGAIQDLVNGLNTLVGAGTYNFLNTGTIGTDAIKQAFLYKPSTVSLVGAFALLDSSVDPRFVDTLNRPALAQTFEEIATGEVFTAVVNHFKSKGSACDAVGDPDTGDGQGNCNITRKNAAIALADWLATDPTASGDPDFLILGDLNSYAKEDPIAALTGAGFEELIDRFITQNGKAAYSYTFFGQQGYLDHALATQSMVSQVTGVTEWHINADEPVAIDYNEEWTASINKNANQLGLLYNADPFRSSDHDPIVIGLVLGSEKLTGPVPTFAEVSAQIAGLSTSAGSKNSLQSQLANAKNYVDSGNYKVGRTRLTSFIAGVVALANRPPGDPHGVPVMQANDLICVAALILVNQPTEAGGVAAPPTSAEDTISGLFTEIAALSTSSGTKNSLNSQLSNIQTLLNGGDDALAKSRLATLITQVVGFSHRAPGDVHSIPLGQANRLAFGAVNVLVGI